MSNASVTDGAGFTGSNFVDEALEKDWFDKIYVVDKLTYAGNKDNVPVSDKVDFHEIDLADISNELLSKVDIIYNFAAETHVDNAIKGSLVFSKNNYYSVHKLIERIRHHQTPPKFIQVSTDEVYGQILEGSFTEDSKLNPRNPYSASKAAIDLLLNSYHVTYGSDIIITRSSNNYGPRQHTEKLIPKIIHNFLNDLPIGIYGDGKQIRDWTYVKDNCNGIYVASQKGEAGEIYNISANIEKENIEVVMTILAKLDKSENLIEFVEDRLGHDFRYSISTDKIRKLGWKPTTMFEEGLEKTINWYMQL